MQLKQLDLIVQVVDHLLCFALRFLELFDGGLSRLDEVCLHGFPHQCIDQLLLEAPVVVPGGDFNRIISIQSDAERVKVECTVEQSAGVLLVLLCLFWEFFLVSFNDGQLLD